VNKQIKKRFVKIVLSILVLNIIIVPSARSIAIPVGVAAPLARFLFSAGHAIYGIVASYITSRHSNLSIPIDIKTDEIVQNNSCEQKTSEVVIPVIANEVINEVKKNEVAPHIITAKSEAIQIESIKTYIDSLVESTSSSVAKKVISDFVKIPYKGNIIFVPNKLVKSYFKAIPIPYGVQLQSADGRFYLPIQFSNKSILNAQRMVVAQYIKDMQILRSQMRHDPEVRARVLNDVRNAISCLINTHVGSFDERIVACMALDNIYIQAPVMNELVAAIQNLKEIYFHRDGSICFQAFYRNTNVPSIITNFVEKIRKQLGRSVRVDNLIDPTTYRQLKVQPTPKSTGIKCKGTNKLWFTGKKFNQDLLSLIYECRKFNFDKAQAIQQKYPTYSSLQTIIDAYKNRYNTALKKIYNEHSIIRVAEKDPVYIANKNIIDSALLAEKEIINQNFLVRYHLKEQMHQKWKISKNCSQEVHDALYQIIGDDCSAISDISLLQAKIEHVIESASRAEYDGLVHAFYEQNGVLKEHALHYPRAKQIKMFSKILTKRYQLERNKLNTLLCEQIKKTEYSALAQEAMTKLEQWLNTTNTKDQMAAKAEFDVAYEMFHQKQKVPAKPQANDIVDVNSSAPIPPDPDEDFEKDNIKVTSEYLQSLRRVRGHEVPKSIVDDVTERIFMDDQAAHHTFRACEGHIPVDTPANRSLLIDVAKESKNFLGIDKRGNWWFAKKLDNGSQVWSVARPNTGRIWNGGINLNPIEFNIETGLCKLRK